jgi:hypothetical protein
MLKGKLVVSMMGLIAIGIGLTLLPLHFYKSTPMSEVVGYAENYLVPAIMVKDIKTPEGSYMGGDRVHAELKIFNPMKTTEHIRIDWKVINSKGESINADSILFECMTETETNIDLPWAIPKDLAGGHYFGEVTIWRQVNTTPQLVSYYSASNGFWVFQKEERFKTIDTEKWGISDKTLGRSVFSPNHLAFKNEHLQLLMPKGTTNGAEIYTNERLSYGQYEVRMKLPLAPSSLTGFFFYEPPDYFHEIDIEVLNTEEGILYLTTYANGQQSNTYSGRLNFDPTAAYHNYLIDYSEKGVSFYIDGKWFKTWVNGIPQKPMRLMLNSWYPKWLEGQVGQTDTYLIVEWIRYN